MKINAQFTRYSGEPLSMYAVAIDGVLVIAKKGKPSTKKDNGMALLVDSATQENYDMLFASDRFMDGLNAYFDLKSCGKITIADDLAQYRPDNSIEVDGLTQAGKINYRFSDVSNGQAAVLAVCLYYREHDGFSAAMNMSEKMTNFFMSI